MVDLPQEPLGGTWADIARAMAGWAAWGAGVSLLPFVMVALFFRLQQGDWPDLASLFGAGQALLVSVGMFASAVREMLKKRQRDSPTASILGWLATLSLAASMGVYGFIQNDVLADRTRNPTQEHEVAVASLILLGLGVLTAASSVGLSKRLEAAP